MSDADGSDSTVSPSGGLSRYETVSGSTVTISSAIGDLSEPWFGQFYLRGNHVYRAFETAPAGTFESHVEHALAGQIIERLSVTDGELMLAHNEETLTSLAALRGTWHDVYTWLNGPCPDTSQLAHIFDDVVFTDSRGGIRARPRMPAEIKLYGIELKKYVPGIAFLTVLDGADAVDLVPKWSGARTEFGEIWTRPVEGAGHSGGPLLMHASRTAVTLARPDRKPGTDVQRALDFLAELDVSWE